MKYGFDFHGVLTEITYTNLFATILQTSKLYIMTGSSMRTFTNEVKKYSWLENKFLNNEIEFFSISDYLQENYPDKIEWPLEDHPVCDDEELWNRVKGEYAEKEGIDLTFDDNPNYLKYFKTPFTLVVNERNVGLLSDLSRREPSKPLFKKDLPLGK